MSKTKTSSATVKLALSSRLLLLAAVLQLAAPGAGAIGPIPTTPVSMHVPPRAHVRAVSVHVPRRQQTVVRVRHESPVVNRSGANSHKKSEPKLTVAKKPAVLVRPLQPQSFSERMSSRELAPGVVYKYFRGSLSLNLLDIDMHAAPVKVQPLLAGECFNLLKDVADHAKKVNAIAAVNANYFKRPGTPLGTLIIDGEWVAGPLYDRVSMGITRQGTVRIDRVSFGGLLTSDNPDLPKTWINNINQPHRSGCHLFAYSKRWGASVHLPYEGSLVAIDEQGKVVGKALQELRIPIGGYVLCDSKDSPISKLVAGNTVKIEWQTHPVWDDVVEAVSGGPMLIKDGQLYLDLKDENFKRGWTGSQIKARTVAGVTANNHLLLATIEGPHTLWDVAKFLRKLGAIDAMNLDGGGSTTMVVGSQTVTRNAHSSQRRVPSSIVVLDTRKSPTLNGLSGAAVYSVRSTVNAQVNPAPAPDLSAAAQDKSGSGRAGSGSTQVQGMSSSPAQILDVQPATTVDTASQPAPKKKKRHFFGLFH